MSVPMQSRVPLPQDLTLLALFSRSPFALPNPLFPSWVPPHKSGLPLDHWCWPSPLCPSSVICAMLRVRHLSLT